MANVSKPPDYSDGYFCGICGQRFHHPSLIYCCNYGHFFCQNCYKHEYYGGRGPLCPHRQCKSHIYRMDKHILKRGNSDYSKTNKMFPNPDEIAKEVLRETASNKSMSSLFRDESINCILALSSKKPVNCPYPGCRKTIAVTAVDSHFKYEHKNVASISTPYETRNGLEINPYDVQSNQKACIVLINVINEADDFRLLSGKVPIGCAKPVMLVMASRVPCYKLEDKDEEAVEEEECSEEFDSFNCYPFDKIIFWVASNIPTKCRYTMAISTPCKAIRLKYVGPVSQVNEDSVKLCEDGKGLILNQPHIIGMTSNGKKSLSLDVVLHKDIQEINTEHSTRQINQRTFGDRQK